MNFNWLLFTILIISSYSYGASLRETSHIDDNYKKSSYIDERYNPNLFTEEVGPQFNPFPGLTEAKWSVNASGSSEYSIQLISPRGRNDLNPNLNLKYNSDFGNKLLGVGWYIDGIGKKIHRCKVRTLEEKGEIKINYDEEDKICINGERLIKKGGVYIPYMFSNYKVIKSPEFDGFYVEYDNGVIENYGKSPSHKTSILSNGESDTWYISETIDNNNNIITYDYHKNNGVAPITTEISYVGGKYEFIYSNRVDTELRFVEGGNFSLNKLLTEIKVYGSESSYVGKYNLNYTQSQGTNRSLLNVINFENELHGKKTTSLHFEWEASKQPVWNETKPTKKGLGKYNIKFYDNQKDGKYEYVGIIDKTDELEVKNPETCEIVKTLERGAIIDSNGVRYVSPNSEFSLVGDINNRELGLSTVKEVRTPTEEKCGSGTYTLVEEVIDSCASNSVLDIETGVYNTECTDKEKNIADINGDEKKDSYNLSLTEDKKYIIMSYEIDGTSTDVKLSRGYQFFTLSDVNMDGSLDILSTKEDSLSIHYFSGVNYLNPVYVSLSQFKLNEDVLLYDFNNDGYPDLRNNEIVYLNEHGKISNTHLSLNIPDSCGEHKFFDQNSDGWVDVFCSSGVMLSSESKVQDKIVFASSHNGFVNYKTTYSSLTDPEFFNQEIHREYPNINTTPLKYAVNRIEVNSKGYDKVTYDYKYSGGIKNYKTSNGTKFRNIEITKKSDVLEVTKKKYKVEGIYSYNPKLEFKEVLINGNLQLRRRNEYHVLKVDENIHRVLLVGINDKLYNEGDNYLDEITRYHYNDIGVIIANEKIKGDNGQRLEYLLSEYKYKQDVNYIDFLEINANINKQVSEKILLKDVEDKSKRDVYFYSYDSRGNVINSIFKPEVSDAYDPRGRFISNDYQYDIHGNVLEKKVSGLDVSRVKKWRYDSHGLFITKLDIGLRAEYKYKHDKRFGHITEEVTPEGIVKNYRYDWLGRIIKTTDNGVITKTAYKPPSQCPYPYSRFAYHCESKLVAEKQLSFSQYDVNNRTIRELSQSHTGNITSIDKTWTIGGLISNETQAYFINLNASKSSISYKYDDLAREIERNNFDSKDNLYRQYQFSYGLIGSGRSFKKTIYPNQTTAVEVYDYNKNIIQKIHNDKTRNYSYSVNGLLVGTFDHNRDSTIIGYDELGHKVYFKSPSTGVNIYEHNALGEVTESVDANKVKSTYLYDNTGRVVEKITGNDISRWVYDTQLPGTISSTYHFSSLDGNVIEKNYTYNNKALVTKESININGIFFDREYTYNALNKLASEKRPDGEIYLYDYSPDGDLIAAKSTVDEQLLQYLSSTQFETYVNELITNSTLASEHLFNSATKIRNDVDSFENALNYGSKIRYKLDYYSSNLISNEYPTYNRYCNKVGRCFIQGSKLNYIHGVPPIFVNIDSDVLYEINSFKNTFVDGEDIYDTTLSKLDINTVNIDDYILQDDFSLHYDETNSYSLVRENISNVSNFSSDAYDALISAVDGDKLKISDEINKIIEQLNLELDSVCRQVNVVSGELLSSFTETCKSDVNVVTHTQALAKLLDEAKSHLPTDTISDFYVYHWQKVSSNAFNKIESELYGNGVVNQYMYDEIGMRLTDSFNYRANGFFVKDKYDDVRALINDNVLNFRNYEYDSMDNVVSYRSFGGNFNYFYDEYDRLIRSNNESYLYDSRDNLIQKGQTTIKFDGYQAKSINDDLLLYDLAGNLVSSNDKRKLSIAWGYNNQLMRIHGKNTVSFSYDENNSRFIKLFEGQSKTYYLSKDIEFTQQEDTCQFKNFLHINGRLISTTLKQVDCATRRPLYRKIEYFHVDALGSADLITDFEGEVLARKTFAPWGDEKSKGNNQINRGFTGHENIQEFALVHMNGRVYDPILGRFISPDPYVQDPFELGNYNRYSYVLNNPLKYTDPTGYNFKSNSSNRSSSGGGFGGSCDVGSSDSSNSVDSSDDPKCSDNNGNGTDNSGGDSDGDGSSSGGSSSPPEPDLDEPNPHVSSGLNVDPSVAKAMVSLGSVYNNYPPGVAEDIYEALTGQAANAEDIENIRRATAVATAALGVVTRKVVVAKKKAATADVGDTVETPDSNPEKFTNLGGGQGMKNKKTKEIWQESNTNHSGDSVGEFKVGVGGKPPTPSKKITVTRSDCQISKKNGC